MGRTPPGRVPPNFGDADQSLPWYGHPDERGRDIQAAHVAGKVEQTLTP
ncbi:hypothetical protein [Streptomyces sp. NPDC058155]